MINGWVVAPTWKTMEICFRVSNLILIRFYCLFLLYMTPYSFIYCQLMNHTAGELLRQWGNTLA